MRATTYGWLIGAALLLGFHRVGWRQHYVAVGVTLLALTAGRWLIVHGIEPRFWHRYAEFIATTPLANLVFVAGALIAGATVGAGRLLEKKADASIDKLDRPGLIERLHQWPQIVIGLGGWLLIAALALELDRLLGMLNADGIIESTLSRDMVNALSVTLLVGATGLGMTILAGMTQRFMTRLMGTLALLAAAAAWLWPETLLHRIQAGLVVSTPVLNLPFLVGAGLLACLIVGGHALVTRPRTDDRGRAADRIMGAIALTLAGLVGLWRGSL